MKTIQLMKLYSLDKIVKLLNAPHYRIKYIIKTRYLLPHVTAGGASLYDQDTFNLIRIHLNDRDIPQQPYNTPILVPNTPTTTSTTKWVPPVSKASAKKPANAKGKK